MKDELRFCIGKPNGPHSTIWKVWTNHNDIYLSSRILASEAKVSLHESGECQFSNTSESFAQLGRKNRERHMQRWQRRLPYPQSNVVYLFRVIFPQSELRIASAEEKVAKNVIWYPSPTAGYGAYVELWLTPRVKEAPIQAQFMNNLLGVLTLENGRYVAITGRYMKIKPQDIVKLKQLHNDSAKILMHKNPGTRGWVLTFNKQNFYTLVEFAPFSDY